MSREKCTHKYMPVKLEEHPNDSKLKIVWVVCTKCYAHRVYHSEYLG